MTTPSINVASTMELMTLGRIWRHMMTLEQPATMADHELAFLQ
jgi:hypothetical protein